MYYTFDCNLLPKSTAIIALSYLIIFYERPGLFFLHIAICIQMKYVCMYRSCNLEVPKLYNLVRNFLSVLTERLAPLDSARHFWFFFWIFLSWAKTRVCYHKMARTISNSKATYIAKRQMMTYAMVIFYLTNHTGTVVQKMSM